MEMTTAMFGCSTSIDYILEIWHGIFLLIPLYWTQKAKFVLDASDAQHQ